MTLEELIALLESLSPETDEGEIRKAHEFVGGQITALRSTAKTLEDAKQLKELRAHQDSLQSELQRRVDEAAAVQEALDATKDPVEAPAAPEAPAAGGEGGEPPADPPSDPAGDDEPDPDENEPAGDKIPVTASARAKARGEQPSSEKEPTDSGKQPKPFVWTAAAGQAKLNHGTVLDKDTMAELFNDAREKAMRAGSEGGDFVVASTPSFASEGEVVLDSRDGVARSDAMVKGIQARWAKDRELPYQADRITAAICEPLEVIRAFAPFQGVTDTPFGDIFPRAPMARLGVRLTKRSTQLSDFDAGFTFPFTGQDSVDEANPATWKPCITMACPTTFDVLAEELTACFKVRDDTAMSSPETVEDFQELLFVARARRREQYLLAKFDGHTDTVNLGISSNVFNSGVDAIPQFCEVVNTALAHAQYENRINLDVYTLVMPPNIEKVFKIGRTKKAYGDEQITTAEVETRIRAATGVGAIVWLRDNRNGGVGTAPQPTIQASTTTGNPEPVLSTLDGGFLDSLNAAYRVRLVAPGDAIYGVVGEMQTGLMTDPQLLRQNMQQWFLKEWVGFGKNGANPWMTLDFNCLIGNGGYVGFLTPVSCAVAS